MKITSGNQVQLKTKPTTRGMSKRLSTPGGCAEPLRSADGSRAQALGARGSGSVRLAAPPSPPGEGETAQTEFFEYTGPYLLLVMHD